MARVHIFRHCEGLHNLRQDVNIRDAELTQRGLDAAQELGKGFLKVNTDCVGAVIASPLRRAILTCLEAFPRVLSSECYVPGSGKGVKSGVRLSFNEDLQEISDMPCNTGSAKEALAEQFPELDTQIQELQDDWFAKIGRLSPGRQAVKARKTRILQMLWDTATVLEGAAEENRTDIVVVTHDGIIQELIPTANIGVGSFKSFTLAKSENGEISLR